MPRCFKEKLKWQALAAPLWQPRGLVRFSIFMLGAAAAARSNRNAPSTGLRQTCGLDATVLPAPRTPCHRLGEERTCRAHT